MPASLSVQGVTGSLVTHHLSGLSSRRDVVQEHLIELSIGDTLQVGQYKVTLLDVDGGELCFQIDGDDDGDCGNTLLPEDLLEPV